MRNGNTLSELSIAFLEEQEESAEVDIYQPIGITKCFCENSTNYPDETFLSYYNRKNVTFEFQDNEGHLQEEPICYFYFKSVNKAYMLKQLCQYSTILINYGIKDIMMRLIKYMGCDSESQQATFITIFIFICQYFNTGFLILLSNANFHRQFSKDSTLDTAIDTWFS